MLYFLLFYFIIVIISYYAVINSKQKKKNVMVFLDLDFFFLRLPVNIFFGKCVNQTETLL